MMEEATGDLSENTNQQSCDEYDSDNEDFYFESDFLPLRGNGDYRAVLRTIVILEAQRIEAAKHIDKIAQLHKRALEDPEEFLKKLISKEGLDLPTPINIQNVRTWFDICSSFLYQNLWFNILFHNSGSKNQV